MHGLKSMLIATAATLALAAALTPSADAQTIKVGVFDPQQVSEATRLGKSVQAELTALRDRKQSEIKDKEQRINDLQRQLQQQELSLSPDRRSTMEKDIRRQVLELESAREAASRELQLEVASAQNSFEEKLLRVVDAFGRDEGFSLILDRTLVAYSSAGIDVTTAIVDRFDRMFPPSEE